MLTPEQAKELEKRKKFLKRYRKNREMVRWLEEKVETLNLRITSLSSPKYSGMPKGEPITTEDLIAEKIEIEERLKETKAKGKKIRREITSLIDNLEDKKHAEVLELFFVEGKEFEEISLIIGYTKRHTIRLYSEGVLMLDINPSLL